MLAFLAALLRRYSMELSAATRKRLDSSGGGSLEDVIGARRTRAGLLRPKDGLEVVLRER